MVTALYVFGIIGAFLIGGLVSWTAKEYVDAFIDNAAYAKSIVHPEMLDEDGNIMHDELLYVRPTSPLDLEEEDEDDEE